MKKTFTLFTAMLSMTATAMAATGNFAVDGLEYDYYNDGVMLVGYNDECQGDVVVPSSVKYEGETYRIIELANNSFQGCTALTSIELPTTLERIGSLSFYGCTNLRSIDIPGGTWANSKYITYDGVLYAAGEDGTQLAAFPAARTGVFDMTDDVMSMWLGAFAYTKLSKINLSESLTAIKADAFEGCNGLILEIDKEDGIIEFNDAAFEGATSYTIYVPKSCQDAYAAQTAVGDHLGQYDEVDGIRYAYKSGGRKIVVGLTQYKYPADLVVPATVTIGGYTYDVTEVSDYALSCRCDLETVTLPSSIERLGSMNFVECFMLGKINFDNTKYTVKDGILYSNDTTYGIALSQLAVCPAALTGTVELPSTTTDIWKGAFSHAKVSEVIISSTLKAIKDETFKGCINLKEVIFKTSNVPTSGFGNDVFAGCELVIIRVPKGCKSKFESAVTHLKNVIVLEEGEEMPTKVNAVQMNPVKGSTARKFIKDGQIVIEKDGDLYDLNGRKL